MSVDGVDQVVGRLHLRLNDIKNEKTERAVTALLNTGGSHASELTPIDSSNLIQSQFRKTWETDFGVEGAVYYEAFYAKWVHEMPGTLKGQPRKHFGRTSEGVDFGGGTQTGNYWDPTGEPHFLTKGMDEMKTEAPGILQAIYQVDV